MCGISGFSWGIEHGADPEKTLTEMLEAISHRGPDASGLCLGPGVAIGHVRLSIIDLQGGTQPMQDHSGRYTLTYNGELFNYIELRLKLEEAGRSFRTRSDTEVVLQAYAQWGSSCVERFNGQFAFAIWDRLERCWFLARDPFGERPLFYTLRGRGFAFASEIKAIFQIPGIPRNFSKEDLGSVALNWTTLPDRTVFEGVKQLPPGSSMVVKEGEVPQWSFYYHLPEPGHEPGCPKAVRTALEQSVRLRLRSDVEVGTYLSGGLDSTAITKMAVDQVGSSVRSFSVGFDDPAYDETALQNIASDSIGTRHHRINIESVGSSRVDLQACKLEYSIVSPK